MLCDVNLCLVVGSIFSTRWCRVNLCALRPYVHHGRCFSLWAQTLMTSGPHCMDSCAPLFTRAFCSSRRNKTQESQPAYNRSGKNLKDLLCHLWSKKHIASVYKKSFLVFGRLWLSSWSWHKSDQECLMFWSSIAVRRGFPVGQQRASRQTPCSVRLSYTSTSWLRPVCTAQCSEETKGECTVKNTQQSISLKSVWQQRLY